MGEGGGGQPERLDYATPQRRRITYRRLPPDWRRRSVIALLAAALVFALTLESAYRQQRKTVWAWGGGFTLQRVLPDLQRDVDRYAQATGKAPATLDEVPAVQKRWSQDPQSQADPWGRPFLLKNENGRAVVMTLGRDGLPGGEGVDADVTAASPTPSVSRRQFFQVMPLKPILWTCVIAAVVTALAAFVGPIDTRVGPRNLLVVLVTLAITGAAAVIVGGFITALHVPLLGGGH